jgi:hypothetical protein
LGKRFGVKVLIETGTYLGDMIEAAKTSFREVYSIELSPELASRAGGRFAEYPSVKIVCGDSGRVLPEVLKPISEPCLFWLDGHYSGGTTARGSVYCPVLEELHHIRSHRVKSHIIIIDDARLFSMLRSHRRWSKRIVSSGDQPSLFHPETLGYDHGLPGNRTE